MKKEKKWTISETHCSPTTPGRTPSSLKETRFTKKLMQASCNPVTGLNVQYLLLQTVTFILMTLQGSKNLQLKTKLEQASVVVQVNGNA